MNKKIIERMIVVFCLIGGILLGFLIYSFFQLFHSDLGYETYEIYEVEGDYHISECIWSNTVKSISGEISKSPEALEKALKEIAAEKVKERIKSIYNYYQWFYVELPYDIEKMLVEGEKYILFVCEQSEDVYWKNGENEFCGGVYQNQYQEEISNLPLESYMFSVANPLEQEELAEIGSMIWEIPELKKPELDRIEADQYTESVVEYIQGELFRMEKQGTYGIYFGRYEILNPYTRNITVAVVGENNYFMQYWVTEWDENTYECWPVGDGYMEPCMDEICAERINRIVSLERLKVTVTPDYSICTDGTSVVVKGRGNNFFWKEYFSYADNIVDAYFSDKAKRKVEKAETGFLYVDLGDLGEWLFDPFGNVDGEIDIEPQFIPNELIEKVKEDYLGKYPSNPMEELEKGQLSAEELKNQAPELYTELMEIYSEGMQYYRADYDNDGQADILVNNILGAGTWAMSEMLFYKNPGNGSYTRTFRLNNTKHTCNLINYDDKNFYVQMIGKVIWGQEYVYNQCEIFYFQDGHPVELVTLSLDETKVIMEVKRKFENDLLNMSDGFR